MKVVGDGEQLCEIWHRMDSEKPGGEPFVDGGEENGHHRGAGVDPPIGDGPLDLRSVVGELVGLRVPVAVHLLAHRYHDVRRRPGHPWVESGRHVLRLVSDGGNALPDVGVGDNDHPDRLAVACRRGSERRCGDSLECVGVDGCVVVVADHPSSSEHFGEFHVLDSVTPMWECVANEPEGESHGGGIW